MTRLGIAPRATNVVVSLRIAGTLLLASLFIPALARADTTIDFEQYSPGTVITNQYADAGGPGQGVVFGPLPGGTPSEGLKPVIRQPAAGQPQSGTRVADIATCVGCEFFTPRTTGTFSQPRSQVLVYVGLLGAAGSCTNANPDAPDCAVVSLRGFDANGSQVAASSVLVNQGAGIHTLLSISTASATIVGFEISGRPTIDASKQIAIDDLTFGTPPPPTPDFTLNPSITFASIEQGGSVNVPITIGRLGGSTGGVSLSAPVLPAGVAASFSPNPAPGTQSVLTLSANPVAQTGFGAVTVTGTPQTPSAGTTSRSFNFTLIVRPACPHVSTAQALVDKLADGFKCIFIAGAIDLTEVLERPVTGPEEILGAPRAIISVPDGVTLMSNRSPTHRGGVLFLSHRVFDPDHPERDKRNMLHLGWNTRVTGLRLQGYNQYDRKDRKDQTSAIQIFTGGVRIDNNEFYGWPNAGVRVSETTLATSPRVIENFFHNNVQCNRGYGVTHNAGGFSRMRGNLFNYNRHDVAGHGDPGDGYIAEFNFSLTSGPKCDPGDTFQHYNQHYDMHGDGLRPGSGIAGSFMRIRHNTIRGAQQYYQVKRRPAFWLRGTPQGNAHFIDNVVHTPWSIGGAGAVRVTGADAGDLRDRGKLVVRDTRCFDTAHQLAVGDFNGDGRDDVFQALGTHWVYSPSGQREWFFLHDSPKLLGGLGIGDFDGDGRSDVFTQHAGRWYVSDGGTGNPRPLPAGSNIDIDRYRFADFDGDGRTDVFRANGSRFFISSAGATAWQPLATSGFKLEDLRFGDFNGDGKTDGFSFANNQWSVSFGATTRWTRINGKLASSLGNLVFADFNGDGKTDIARTGSRNWEVSLGGATPWRVLQYRRSEPLSQGTLFGDFNGDRQDDALRHGVQSSSRPLPILCGIGSGNPKFRSFERFLLSSAGERPPVTWSWFDMR